MVPSPMAFNVKLNIVGKGKRLNTSNDRLPFPEIGFITGVMKLKKKR